MADEMLSLDNPAAIDRAFDGNLLLATMPPELRTLLRDHVAITELDVGDPVLRRGIDVDVSLFPLDATMISMVVDLGDGRSVEVASVGREGAVGGIVSCGHSPAFTRAETIVGGRAVRLPLHVIEQAKAASGHLRNLFCRYSDYLLAQVMQSVACNAYHSIEARVCRWLLTANERAGGRLELTQEALAGLLGVQRTTINAVARELQDEGLITTRRGTIEINDRAGIEARACECHGRVERFFGDIIGPGGVGGLA